jgi:flagellar motor switch protein FliG
MRYIVLITKGQNETADHFSISLFDTPERACNFCSMINGIKLIDGVWMYAEIIKMNKKYPIRKPRLLSFAFDTDIKITDDRLVRKLLMEIEARDSRSRMLRIALYNADEETKKKILMNMPKWLAQTLEDEIDSVWGIDEDEVKLIKGIIMGILINLKKYQEIEISTDETIETMADKYSKKHNKMAKTDSYLYNDSANDYRSWDITLVMYGHNEAVEEVSVSLFESGGNLFCDAMNKLKLKDDQWVYAMSIHESQEYETKKPHVPEEKPTPEEHSPVEWFNFDDILKLSDLAVDRALRGYLPDEIFMALKYTSDEVREKIFMNVPAKSASSIKERIKFMDDHYMDDPCYDLDMSYVRDNQREILEKAKAQEAKRWATEPRLMTIDD